MTQKEPPKDLDEHVWKHSFWFLVFIWKLWIGYSQTLRFGCGASVFGDQGCRRCVGSGMKVLG